MEIRELGEADATEYRELRLRALREHPESFLSSYEAERARPETEVAARLARSAESPDDFILGCYVDDELVGMIGFSRDDREKQRHRGFIWGMHATWFAHSCMSGDRRSSRSLRRYAASVAFWTTWARADSASSRGTPVSAHQLRKLLRIPCGVPSIPRSRSSFEMVLSLSGLPRTEGNISLEPSSRLRASCSTSRACWESGTRCGRPAFMRSAGMVHVKVSISDHSARRASPLRVAVKVKNARHNFVLG